MSTSTPSDRGADATHPTGRTDGKHEVAHEHHAPQDRRTVLARQKEEHGGVKIGAAFFGFLTSLGMAVLLTGLVTAAGAAVGLATGTDAGDAADASVQTISLAAGIALLAIVFLAYYAGGYVAGRMARFNGIKQGVAVWVWALVVAAVIAILGIVAGDKYDVLAQLNTFPRIPVNEGDLTRGGVIAALVLLGVSLLGSVAGGLAGMRFHRAVDRTGLPR